MRHRLVYTSALIQYYEIMAFETTRISMLSFSDPLCGWNTPRQLPILRPIIYDHKMANFCNVARIWSFQNYSPITLLIFCDPKLWILNSLVPIFSKLREWQVKHMTSCRPNLLVLFVHFNRSSRSPSTPYSPPTMPHAIPSEAERHACVRNIRPVLRSCVVLAVVSACRLSYQFWWDFCPFVDNEKLKQSVLYFLIS